MLLQKLNQNLFFLYFDLVEEAYWVMENGSRIFRGEAMHLEWWSPSIGCRGRTEEVHEEWIRVVGLPLHLWTVEILKKVRNACGGFIALDKDTEQRNDLRWARILVKKERTGKPSSANLLAGARSYELQIWWEIHPRVEEVYPRGCRNKDLLVVSSGEDEGTTRAQGRVDAEKSHFSRERQYDECQREVLEKSGKGGGVSQRTKSARSYRVGPNQRIGFQKSKGISGKVEGDKQVTLWDFKKRSLGHQIGKRAALNRSPKLSTIVGQSPISCRAQTKWPIKERALNDERVKRMGSDGVKTIGTVNKGFVFLQRSTNKGGEEKEHQENTPSSTAGQEVINKSDRGMSREEGRLSREAKGKQIEEMGRSIMEADRESISGKFLRDTLSCSVGGVGGVEEVSIVGEKGRRFSQTDDSLCNIQAERGNKPTTSPNSTPEAKVQKLGLEVEEDCATRADRKGRLGKEVMGQHEVTRPTSPCRGKTNKTVAQEQNNLVSGRGYGADRRSGSTVGSDLETGRVLNRSMGLDLIQLSPSPMTRPITVGLTSSGHMGFETVNEGEETEQNQNPVSRLPMPSAGRVSTPSEPNIAEEGNNEFSRKEGEIREDLHQDDDCDHMERYVNNYDQSPPSRFSVFGRPLLQGDCSGLGGISGNEDLELMRKEAEKERAWGRVPVGASIADGEVDMTEGRRGEETQQESIGNWKYDNWESSCLAKFSEFLGFPTKGFEKEILELLRILVDSLKNGKEKGNMTVTRSERELRRLKSTINYNGKQTTRGGGREKGNSQIKL